MFASTNCSLKYYLCSSHSRRKKKITGIYGFKSIKLYTATMYVAPKKVDSVFMSHTSKKETKVNRALFLGLARPNDALFDYKT